MPKADNDPITSSRRAVLAGSTAVLLVGAVAATTVRAAPLAAPAAADVIPIRPPKIHCVKTGPCPCEEPCYWGARVLDDVQQAEWQDLVQRVENVA